MDIVSYVRGAQALRNVRILDQNIVGAQAEATFASVDERLKWLEKQTGNSLYHEAVTIDMLTGDRTNIKPGFPLTLIDETQVGTFISEVIDLGAHHKERKMLNALLTDAIENEQGLQSYANNSIKIEYQASSNSTSWYGYYTASLDEGLTHKTDTYPTYRYMRIKITITPIKKEIYDEENTLIDEVYQYHKLKGIHINRTCLSPVGLLYRLDSAILIENMRLDFKVLQLLNHTNDAYQSYIIFADSLTINKDTSITYSEDYGCLQGEGYITFDDFYSPIAIRTIATAIMGEIESIEVLLDEWQPLKINELTALTTAIKTMKVRIRIKEGQKFYGLGLSWLLTI